MQSISGISPRKKSLVQIGCVFLLTVFSLILPNAIRAAATNYTVRGIVKQIDRPENRLVITHEAIPGFMDSMTMPFKVKDGTIPEDLLPGAAIEFQLHMNDSESWINSIKKIDIASLNTNALALPATPSTVPIKTASSHDGASLYHFKFTNELGQPVSLSDFRGQGVALTFFFTRCPIVDYCPRLTRNFQEAQHELLSMKDAPTNWHLISVSFDTLGDTPETLKAYAEAYQYDPAHWTFLTGPQDKISELANSCNVQFTATNGYFDHNFRTLIIDSSNRLQMVFPIGGDLSKQIVQQLLKAADPAKAAQ